MIIKILYEVNIFLVPSIFYVLLRLSLRNSGYNKYKPINLPINQKNDLLFAPRL